jgi:hypothetical protein
MKVKEKKCKQCWKSFVPYSSLDKYCSSKCKVKWEKEKEKVKKAKAREKKKVSVSTLMKVLDSVFSQYVRLRDCIATTWSKTQLKCFTCDMPVEYKQSQNMHFIPRATKTLRYDERNCHGWCMRCNVILKGNYLEYFIRMEKKYWRKVVDEMLAEKNKIWKLTPEWLQEKIEYYKEQLNLLNK